MADLREVRLCRSHNICCANSKRRWEPDAAGDLVTLMDSIDANRGDIGELRHEMRLGFARIDSRFEQLEVKWEGLFDTHRTEMKALLEKGLREQTRFFFLAWAVLLAAFVGLYAR